MKILVIGNGGREHAICWALSKSPDATEIYCAPGNAGIAEIAEIVNIDLTDFDSQIAFAKAEGIDLTICPMDGPLVLGIVDAFKEAGLQIYGPSKAAAHIEGSKAYSKDFMEKYNIPTMARRVFDNRNSALLYLSYRKFPVWIKTDGLAAGKGAILCQNLEAADKVLVEMLEDRHFGASGDKVVIEEHLDGVECSVLAFCDGKTIIPMPGSMDHKAAFEGNIGPNTGGMGAVAPNSFYTPEISEICMETIFKPTLAGLEAEGREFVGVLFFGLMLTADGPKVLEFNCRPGDPETQATLPMLDTDLLSIIMASLNKNLDNMVIKWKNNAVCCVIAVSGGYPGAYETGHPISGLEGLPEDIIVFHNATARNESGGLITNGGRVLSVVGTGQSSEAAKAAAYKQIERINFTNKRYRKDIGEVGQQRP